MALNFRTRATSGAAVAAIVLAGLFAPTGQPAAQAAVGKALIHADSVTGAPSQEEQIATALGFEVTVVDDATWAESTATDFGQYDLLIVGDPNCGSIPPAIATSASVFGPVVLGTAGGRTQAGNRIVVGTDPVFHDDGDFTSLGARGTIIREGIAYAGSQPGRTGMYYSTSCGGTSQDAEILTTLGAISAGEGSWTHDGDPPCGGAVSLIAANPSFADLSTASLEGWGCSVHDAYPTFPSDWSALAVATDTATTPTCGVDPATELEACGEAYILIAGSSIVVNSLVISVSPLDATNPVATTHTVTANVHAVGGTPVVAGQLVDFDVTGINAGAVGTCVPVSCESDAAGDVAFTYLGGAAAGDDTIKASFTDTGGSLQTATAQKHWTAGGARTLSVDVVGSGSVESDPAGISCPEGCVAGFADGSIVALIASPAPGFAFAGWFGDCTGEAACSVTLDADRAVTATFIELPTGDVSVTGETIPPSVDANHHALVRFFLANAGASAVTNASASVVLPVGVTPVSIAISQGGCAGFTTCAIGTIAPGASITLEIVVLVGEDVPPSTSLGIVVTLSGSEIEPTAGEAGPVVAEPIPGQVTGFVLPRETISTGDRATPANNTIASLRMPSKSVGAPIVLRTETEGVETFCGGELCDGKIVFVSPFEGVDNPRSPVRIKLTWDKSVRGRGTKSKIYVQKAPGGPVTVVPECDRTDKHIAIPSPCIHDKDTLDNGDIEFEILLLSGDPRFARR